MTDIEIKILKTVTQVMKPYLVNSENRILHSSLITALNEAFVQTEVVRFLVIEQYPSMTCKVGDIIELPSKHWTYSDGTFCGKDFFEEWGTIFQRVNKIEEIISVILSDDYPYISPLDYEDEEVCRKKLRDLFEGLNLSS